MGEAMGEMWCAEDMAAGWTLHATARTWQAADATMGAWPKDDTGERSVASVATEIERRIS